MAIIKEGAAGRVGLRRPALEIQHIAVAHLEMAAVQQDQMEVGQEATLTGELLRLLRDMAQTAILEQNLIRHMVAAQVAVHGQTRQMAAAAAHTAAVVGAATLGAARQAQETERRA